MKQDLQQWNKSWPYIQDIGLIWIRLWRKDRSTESDRLLVAVMDQWEYLRARKLQRSLLRMTLSSWKGFLAKLQSRNGMTLYCNLWCSAVVLDAQQACRRHTGGGTLSKPQEPRQGECA